MRTYLDVMENGDFLVYRSDQKVEEARVFKEAAPAIEYFKTLKERPMETLLDTLDLTHQWKRVN